MAVPGTPTNFYVQQGNGQILLSYDFVATAVSYNIYRSTDDITFTLLASPSVNTYLDTAVSLGTTYYYYVAALNGSGEGVKTETESEVPTLPGFDTLGSLRLQAQQRADKVNSNFLTLPEWNKLINQAAQELYDLLITVYEDYAMAAPYSFLTTNNNGSYQLPDGIISGLDNVKTKVFYKALGVDCGIANNNNARYALDRFNFSERNKYLYPNTSGSVYGLYDMQYRIMGNNLNIIPNPAAGQQITLWYIPRITTLLRDSDILDGVSGWNEYVVVRAAKYALDKEESDSSALTQELAFLKQRIEESANNRDAGNPMSISNTRHRMGSNNGGFGGSTGGW